MVPTTTFKEGPYSSVTSVIPLSPLYIVGNSSDAPFTPPLYERYVSVIIGGTILQVFLKREVGGARDTLLQPYSKWGRLLTFW